jgi:hypothetical protein
MEQDGLIVGETTLGTVIAGIVLMDGITNMDGAMDTAMYIMVEGII